MEGVKKISYLNESNFELIKIEQVSKIVENIKTDKINLIILPGDNLNILKDEFKISKLKNLHSGLTVLRPHPRLSKYDIALLSDLLSIKLTDESIKLSEDLRFIPVDFLMKFKKFNLIFQGVQKSSLQIYCDDQ